MKREFHVKVRLDMCRRVASAQVDPSFIKLREGGEGVKYSFYRAASYDSVLLVDKTSDRAG